MRQHVFAVRLILVGGLAFGWLVGLLAQRSIVEGTGYLDVSPALLVLGMALCALAGAAARTGAPALRRARIGALAGIGMIGSIVAGYVVLAVAYAHGFSPESSGETWWTLLLEAWFWIGVPLAASAVLGSLGWLAADRLDRTGSPWHRPARPR
jgi:hypothetical protein